MLKDHSIIIGIYTCPQYQQRAKGIYDSWLKLVPDNYRVIFVQGRPGQDSVLEGDTLYVDCEEAYENLPQKSHLFFRYCHENLEFDYIFKTDDDSYLDLWKFKSFDPDGGDYIGQFRDAPLGHIGQTWHYGKCSDKSMEVPSESTFICGWALGGGYFVSRKAVKVLVEKTRQTQYQSLFEDKMVGEALTLEPDLKVVRTNYSEFGVINPLLPKDMRYIQNVLLETHHLRLESQHLRSENQRLNNLLKQHQSPQKIST